MGVPPYRLPRTAIDNDVEFIKKLGVEIKYHTTLGVDITFDSLKRRVSPLSLSVSDYSKAEP